MIYFWSMLSPMVISIFCSLPLSTSFLLSVLLLFILSFLSTKLVCYLSIQIFLFPFSFLYIFFSFLSFVITYTCQVEIKINEWRYNVRKATTGHDVIKDKPVFFRVSGWFQSKRGVNRLNSIGCSKDTHFDWVESLSLKWMREQLYNCRKWQSSKSLYVYNLVIFVLKIHNVKICFLF